MTWSPGKYLEFEDERTRPARDLLAQVPLVEASRVVDIGCGPGNSTEVLAERFPSAEIIGLDSSAEMLAAARKRLPAATFIEADAATWMPDRAVDLLFANAVFQWVPDHLAVLARLLEALPSGGVLAVQVPDNRGEASHRMMRETALAGPWAEKFGKPIARDDIPSPATYYDRLRPFATRTDIWHTIYNHPLDGPAAIVEWVRATGLRPFLERLDESERPAFIDAYRSRLAGDYPPLVDGKVLYRFPRLFVVAVR